MKLIIDITDEQFKDCQLTLSSPLELAPVIESHCAMIVNGTPLEEEIDKIKENIKFMAEKCLPNNLAEEFEVKGLKTSIEIIDRELSKLKGEN